VSLFLILKDRFDYDNENSLRINLKPPQQDLGVKEAKTKEQSTIINIPQVTYDTDAGLGKWEIQIVREYIPPNLGLKVNDQYRLNPEAINDIAIVFIYKATLR